MSRPRDQHWPGYLVRMLCLPAARALAGALLALACSTASAANPLIEGLNHVPVAVADLDRAAADFARLGFVIKPGRLHSNGIQNRHVKFPNGGEIELITAASSKDALSAEYVDWLKSGDGPAFWSLNSHDLNNLTARLDALQLAPHREGELITYSGTEPHRLFFGPLLRAPNDGPAYWAHPNTAYKLRAVWLSAAADERRLLTALAGGLTEETGCAPFDSRAQGVILPGDGDEVFVTSQVQRLPPRVIIGVTVLVRDIGTARQVLERADIPFTSTVGCAAPHRGLWIPPSHAHNMWLELRQ